LKRHPAEGYSEILDKIQVIYHRRQVKWNARAHVNPSFPFFVLRRARSAAAETRVARPIVQKGNGNWLKDPTNEPVAEGGGTAKEA